MAFASLPIELNQAIALQIDDDKSLCAFASVCPQSRAAVNGDRSGVWRKRFLANYDSTGEAASQLLKLKYQVRRRNLRRQVQFKDGHSPKELRCLETLRDLIVESCSESSDDGEGVVGRNLSRIREFVTTKSNFLGDICVESSRVVDSNARFRVNPFYHAVQLVLTHLSLDLSIGLPARNFEVSQKAAYEHAQDAAIVNGGRHLTVNVEWLLHVSNFFKYHATCKDEATLFPIYEDLDDCDKPKAWVGRLKDGTDLIGKYWKGSYAYLDDKDIKSIRRSAAGEKVFMDNIDAEAGFQTLKVIAPERGPKGEELFEIFADYFDRLVPANPASEPTKPSRPASMTFVRFAASGVDREPFFAEGRLYPLPPQHGIPGWRHLVMMKYFPDANLAVFDPSSLWAYEGCVLPGGQIILGRWWYPEGNPQHDGRYCGPFIFWNVPHGPEDDEDDGDAGAANESSDDE